MGALDLAIAAMRRDGFAVLPHPVQGGGGHRFGMDAIGLLAQVVDDGPTYRTISVEKTEIHRRAGDTRSITDGIYDIILVCCTCQHWHPAGYGEGHDYLVISRAAQRP